MRKRNAFTLVEMLAVIAVSSVLLVIATGAIQRTMRLERSWEEHADVSRALARLSHDFRDDVHRSREMVLTQGPTTLKLTFPDRTVITYEVAADEIIRDFQSAGNQRNREFYDKPSEYEANFTIGNEPQWVDLQVTRNPRLTGVEPRVVLHVQAEAGRLIRLARGEESTP